MVTIRDDHALARDLAAEAGERLLALRSRDGHDDPAALRHAGDNESHAFLIESLSRLRPDDVILSEEGTREERLDPRRQVAERVWIIDPLDGTREFGEQGRADWAVHVALWHRTPVQPADGPAAVGPSAEATGAASAGSGSVISPPRGSGTLIAGAVALPAQGITLSTAAPPALPARREGPIRIAVSRTRPPEFVQKLAGLVGAELVPMGSAGAKIAAVVTGEVEAYVHGGGQYEWDSAAPVAVALAAGAFASRIDGSPLTYNQENPSLPDILVSLPDLAPTLLAGIRDVHR
ncbi:inositol monophosphatase family protein [Sphaerisporangium melleum]|uniref:inositol monophosphatase family protein n=1 Tax=Sphaerisporangium melleum TaxID=321316 RepID=UPI0016679C29|nr:inositol monophosphatase family protein [Sphaerisporangium melleum]